MTTGVQGLLSFGDEDGGDQDGDAASVASAPTAEAAEPARDAGLEAAGDGSESDEGAALGRADAEAVLVVRVLADVVGLDKEFDYAVPAAWHRDGRAARLAVGSIVRFGLGGRRLRGWVTEVGIEPPAGMELRELTQLSGMGPPPDVMDLAGWAAWRWAGRRVSLLRAASPRRAVHRPEPRRSPPAATDGVAGERVEGVGSVARRGQRAGPIGAAGERVEGDGSVVWRGQLVGPGGADGEPVAGDGSVVRRGQRAGAVEAFDDLFDPDAAVSVVRLPPAADAFAVARAAARRGDALIVAPSVADVRRISVDLRRGGNLVAEGVDGWARAAAGATVVGTRSAVWLPMPRLASVVVLDEHSESLQSEQAPTWHARDVAVERARRAGVPAVLVSPVPTLEALEAGELRTVGRVAERDGWPAVDVLDRRLDDPVRSGPFAEGLRDRLTAAQGTVAVVLNRKGRARLLACKACGELACTSDGRTPMRLIDDELVAADGSERRPVVCAQCGSTVLRNLRMGVTRAREELAALVGEPVGEVTADSDRLGGERIVIGTEAVLWRLQSATAVVFLDFDQELLAPRQRACEQALAMLARGARLTGGRQSGGRLMVQTRQPDHPVVQAALRADPSVASATERDRRRTLRLPPYGAQARISGPGAEKFIAALREAATATVSIRGPVGGQYLLRSPDHDPLLDLLARTTRPAERLRVEVDPLRV